MLNHKEYLKIIYRSTHRLTRSHDGGQVACIVELEMHGEVLRATDLHEQTPVVDTKIDQKNVINPQMQSYTRILGLCNCG